MLQGWVDLGGREKLFDTFGKIFDNFINLVDAVKEAWYNVFPPATADDLMNMTNGFSNFIDSISFSEDTLRAITEILETMFSVMRLGLDAVKNIGEALLGIFGISFDSSAVADSVGKFNDSLKEMGENEFVTDLSNVMKKLQTVFNNFMKAIGNFDVGATIDKIVSGIQSLPEKINELVNKYPEVMALFGIGAATFGTGSLIKGITNIFKGNGGIIGSIKNIFNELGDAIGQFTKLVNAVALKEIAVAIGILALSLFGLSLLDHDMMNQGIKGISILVGEITVAMLALGKMTGAVSSMTQSTDGGIAAMSAKQTSFFSLAAAMIALGAAVLMLSVSAALLSRIPLETTFTNLTMLIGGLVGAAVSLQKWAPEILKSSIGILAIATAVMMLTIPMLILGAIPDKVLSQGIFAIAAIFAGIVGFVKILPEKDLLKGAASMIMIAYAIGMLVKPLLILGVLSLVALPGLLVLAATLTLVALTAKTLNKNAKGGMVLVAIAHSLLALSVAVAVLVGVARNNDLGDILVAVGTLVLLVGVLTVATKVLEKAKGGALALIGMSVALMMLSIPIKILAGSDAGALMAAATALTVVVVACGLMAVVLKNATKGALNMMLLGAAVAVLALGLVPMTKLDTGKLMMAVLAIGLLGGVVVLLGAITQGPIAVGVVIFAGALLAVGAAAGLFGAAIMAVATALQILGQMGPREINNIINAIIMFIQALPRIVDALATTLVECLRVLAKHAPAIIEAAVNLIISVWKGILSVLGKLIGSIGDALGKMLGAIGDALGKFFVAGAQIIGSLIMGLLNMVGNLLVIVGNIIINVFVTIIKGIGTFLGTVFEAALNIGKAIIDGIINGVKSLAGGVIDAVGDIAGNIIGGFCDFLGIHSPSKVTTQLGEYTGQGFVNGLDNKTGEVYDSASGLGSAATEGLNDGISDTDVIGPAFDKIFAAANNANIDSTGLSNSMNAAVTDASAGAQDSAKQAGTDTMNSYSEGMLEGMDFGDDFSAASYDIGADGMTGLSDGMMDGLDMSCMDAFDSSELLGENALNGLNSGLSGDVGTDMQPITVTSDFTQPNAELEKFRCALAEVYAQTAKMEGVINKEEHLYFHITSDPIVVQGVNNQSELVGTVVKTIDTDAWLRDIRKGLRK